MTIILDPDNGKLYSLYREESDYFLQLRHREITIEQVRDDCTFSHDYIKVQSLKKALREEAQP